ncbi:large ribosomal subunit protein uL23-like [Ochotona princeps]|uniref:large ribosomal subunit protein uL23-like n=1 Tax=Ochotona princeps TaxID=9978 RepID=UPI0027151560|nr:large ribosomal subunit protein uL23-like [Ochotona princeps]
MRKLRHTELSLLKTNQGFFTKITQNVWKEDSAAPKAKVKAKALTDMKAVLQGVRNTAPAAAAPVPSEERPLEEQAWPLRPHQAPSDQSRLGRRQHTLLFIPGVKATTHQIKRAVKKLRDTDVTKANALIRPEGEKKADVRLAPDSDTLDVANISQDHLNCIIALILNICFS